MTTKKLDFIDFDSVNKLLEGFNQSTGFVTAILDLKGNILSKSGWREICTEFHRINPETSKKCRISDTILANKMAEGETFHFYQCLNGLVDVAVPIVIRGEHIANLFSGQFFFEKPNILFFKKQAKEYGFDEKKYLDVLKKVPVITKDKIQGAMDFLLSMTEVISELTLHKLEQDELNKALKESEIQYRNLANAGSALIWTSGTDKLCNYFNDPWLKFTGRTLEQEMGNGWTEGVHSDDFDRCVQTYVTAFEKREPFEMEYRLRHNSGEYRIILDKGTPNFDSKGKFLGYIGHCFDITERKQTENALFESEERFALATDASENGIWDWNIVTNEVYFSSQWKNQIGYQEHEIENDFSFWVDNLHPDEKEACLNAVQGYLNNPVEHFRFEFRLRHKDGSYRWIYNKASSIKDKNGKVVRMFGAHTDITQRKEDEEEIKKLNEVLEERVIERTAQLEASNKELEAFSYTVSHDLRAPLRHINGYVDLLNERFRNDLPGKAQQYLANVTDASKQMGTLIDDLLQFSRTGRQEMRWARLDMNVLIKDVLDKVKTETEEREILWDVQHLPQVFGDYALLKQVWVNLIENAIKYSRNKKTSEISIGFSDHKKEFVFYIRDNGVGFDMKYAHKLFGVFQRLHSQAEFEGTGIGLANVMRIISKHNGRVWAEAEPDKGAIFFFSLPKNKEDHHD
jgi:PAS domain S-box-containing protein